MRTSPLTLVLAALGLLVAVGAWLLTREAAKTTPPPASPSPSGAPAQTPAPSVPSGFRLAGTAVGAQGAYAVFEDPTGATNLYRPGDSVPGLGTLLRIEEKKVVVSVGNSEVEFRIRPAPSPSPTPQLTPSPALTPAPSPAAGTAGG